MAPGGLADLLGGVAAAHPQVTSRETGGTTVWQAGGRPFAALAGASMEFRLKPDMARAALRTPNTRASERGPEWVAFEPPPELDRYDLDRLRSWFEMAARLVGG